MAKKMLVALLCMCFGIGTLAGCGSEEVQHEETKTSNVETKESESAIDSSEIVKEEPKEPVTINYYYMNGVGEQQYTNQVEDVLNEILKGMEGYEHITIDLHPSKDFATDFTLAQAAGEQIDLVATFGLDLNTLIPNGDFLPLDDLLENNPAVVSEYPDWLVDMGKMYGSQYVIPSYQQAANEMFVYMPVKYLDMYYSKTGKTEEDIRKILNSGSIEE